MKKPRFIIWYLPLCFFIFLAFFILIKFIFIFFFNAAFEPEFMFFLTPYYLLSGVNSLHLLLISFIVVGFNAYLHFKISKKNLIFSFIPTVIMLAGLGFKIATLEMSISYIVQYILFGVLLIITLVDHRLVLIFPEVTIPAEKERIVKSKPIINRIKPQTTDKPQYLRIPVSERPFDYVSANEIFTLHKETLSDLRSILKDDLKRAKDLLEELEQKTRKIDILEDEIINRKYYSTPQQISFKCPYISFFDKQKNNDLDFNDLSPIGLKKEKNVESYNLNINKVVGCAAVIKRGILKEVNKSFVELLGYEKEILLEKTLFNFVAPEGLFKIEEYYIKRLNGIQSNSYETILINNDNSKIQVEITIKPTKYKDEIADIVIIRELK